jgi:hypothetical protein
MLYILDEKRKFFLYLIWKQTKILFHKKKTDLIKQALTGNILVFGQHLKNKKV